MPARCPKSRRAGDTQRTRARGRLRVSRGRRRWAAKHGRLLFEDVLIFQWLEVIGSSSDRPMMCVIGKPGKRNPKERR